MKQSKEEGINIKKVVRHWLLTSDEDFETMKKLFESKSYSWALFLAHISLEKLLKALFMYPGIRNTPHLPTTYLD